jgi:hypothetical protein
MIEKASAQAAYAIMSFGGFLGHWGEKSSFPWRTLTYDTVQSGYVMMGFLNRQLAAADWVSLRRPRAGGWSSAKLQEPPKTSIVIIERAQRSNAATACGSPRL